MSGRIICCGRPSLFTFISAEVRLISAVAHFSHPFEEIKCLVLSLFLRMPRFNNKAVEVPKALEVPKAYLPKCSPLRPHLKELLGGRNLGRTCILACHSSVCQFRHHKIISVKPIFNFCGRCVAARFPPRCLKNASLNPRALPAPQRSCGLVRSCDQSARLWWWGK